VTDGENTIRLIMELRRQGIRDDRVLRAMEQTPRELFVPEAFRDQAYDNVALPLAQGQTISQPYVVAFMTEALQVTARSRVLEIGTGSGYQAAVLARLVRQVYTIERYRSLALAAEARFKELGFGDKVLSRVGDGMRGWPEAAPFDRILVTAAAPEVPAALLDQLAPGGILVAPIGSASEQEVMRYVRGPGGIAGEALLAVRFVPLVPGVAPESRAAG
jgi:protein-L-isoaspartate(D-aspartate) O-methyltransferase